MSKIFYISDIHFGLPHEIAFENSSNIFSSEIERTNFIIDRWNTKVSQGDDVYIIGDLFYGNKYVKVYGMKPQIDLIMQRLNGKKHLIVGNHDDVFTPQQLKRYFVEVRSFKIIYLDGRPLCMNHYPLMDWSNRLSGGIHLYGHSHNVDRDVEKCLSSRGFAYNVGAMINNYEPCTLEEIIENNKHIHYVVPKNYNEVINKELIRLAN